MPLFLLIRHGENDYVKEGRLAGRKPGVHLNETGRSQAQEVAEKITNAPIKAVYSSPLDRTLETAEPIAQALNLEVVPRAGLNEVDFGEWQGKTLKSLRRRKLWKVVQGAPSQMRFPGGESLAEAQLRFCQELDILAKKHKPKDMLVCVSHSDMIKLAAAYYIGLHLDLFQRLHVSPGSITALNINEMGGHLFSLNYDLSFTFP